MTGVGGSDRVRAWVTLLAGLVLVGLAGCDGDDGDDGNDGSDGDPGLACWDLNENGIKDFPDEDTNGDGVIDSVEAALRTMANDVYSAINEQGDM